MTARSNSNSVNDIASLIHPYTNLARHAEAGPVIMTRGDGVFVEDDQGRRYLEGMSGLWSTSLGFSERRLIDAAMRQFEKLPFYHLFNHRSVEPTIELAERLLAIAPKGLGKVLFANSGSEANDQAVKLVWYYNNALGRPQKKKIISRWRGYHGVTIASGSLTGLPGNHADFDLPIANILHTDAPSHFHNALPGESVTEFAARLVDNLEQLILKEGPETVAAFIAEPVCGSGGVIVPPEGYFEGVQKVLKKYDILFIADEVICGFGRTGNMFGCETYDLKPDIMTVAKALSSSYLPISATLVSDDIHAAMIEQSRKLGGFVHGVTYSGHPVCAAVAVETLKIYEERDIVGHVREVSKHFQQRLRAMAERPHVGEARGVGLIGALELVSDKKTRTPFDPNLAIGAGLQARAMDNGVIVRALRECVAICPPLIIDEAQIDLLFDGVEKAFDEFERTMQAA
ncbi:aspartate aminotransferase family protein [Arvimicrobium flavum]|uniref:aspartate aminotransferase family protein n=1 Tax=Arvimicrobium flavum TaxID=3393320 RepID=UPI00237AAF39|nr:aspartate aminotransferase family protein [Mesorhizobium shangrilense]